jgi:hypothetical protein
MQESRENKLQKANGPTDLKNVSFLPFSTRPEILRTGLFQESSQRAVIRLAAPEAGNTSAMPRHPPKQHLRHFIDFRTNPKETENFFCDIRNLPSSSPPSNNMLLLNRRCCFISPAAFCRHFPLSGKEFDIQNQKSKAYSREPW